MFVTKMNALAKKLQMKPGKRWLLYQVPENYLSLLDPLPEGLSLHFAAEGTFDGMQLFVKNSRELAEGMNALHAVLQPDTILWVIYPKKSSGIGTDLEMTGNWQLMETYGLDAVTAAAVDATWTALRFKPVAQIKKSDTCNAELPATDYSAYIDVVARKITLPPDIMEALAPHPAAVDFYEALSYSNKKEYVLWVLTAKQEKTRQDRLQKMIAKLLQGKKNPAEK